MKSINYQDITIENIQNLVKTGYITEIILDGDNKVVNIKEDEFLQIEITIKQLGETIKPVIDAIVEIGKKMFGVFSGIVENLNKSLDKKITRKKFIKLLQSDGIQRNDINKIIKNNKEKYTYLRYYKIVKEISKDKGE